MEDMHKYQVRAKSTRVRSGVVASDEIPGPIIFSAPPEFAGEPRVWTPEHFFVAALVSCYVATFSGMADLSKFEFECLEVEAKGNLERDATGWRFTEIALTPNLKITREEDRERGGRLLEKAERGCVIARSITARVTVTPTIKVVSEALLAENRAVTPLLKHQFEIRAALSARATSIAGKSDRTGTRLESGTPAR